MVYLCANLVFLDLSVLDLGPMYATDRRQTKASPYGGGGITTKKQNTQITTQKEALVNTDTQKNLGCERGQTEPGLVALYNIQPGNGEGLFFQPRSPHGALPFKQANIEKEGLLYLKLEEDMHFTCPVLSNMENLTYYHRES